LGLAPRTKRTDPAGRRGHPRRSSLRDWIRSKPSRRHSSWNKVEARPRAKFQAAIKTHFCVIREAFVRELDFQREYGSTAIRREPVRDWRFGWATGHRATVVAFMLSMITILLASHSLSAAAAPPRTLVENIVSWASLLLAAVKTRA